MRTLRTTADGLLACLVAAWMYWIFSVVPPAQVQAGAWAQKIFYLHVPSATVSFFGFTLVALISLGVLFGESETWDRRLRPTVEISYLFTSFVLLTGPFWAKPVWGIWWRWEPRMTTFFVLWLMYGGWFLLRGALPPGDRRRVYGAVYALLAFLNVPLVMLSVTFWKPRHQLHPRQIDLDPIMRGTLYASFAVLTLLFLRLLWMRLDLETILRNEGGTNRAER